MPKDLAVRYGREGANELLAQLLRQVLLKESPFRFRELIMGRPGFFVQRAVASFRGLALRSTSFYAQDSVTKVQLEVISLLSTEVVAEFLDHPHRLPWGRQAGVGDPGPHGQGGCTRTV